MGHLKNTDGIEITFLQRISAPLWFIYEIKLENISDKQAKYDMRYLTCNAGINAMQNRINNVLGYELLTSGNIKKGESVTGYIAFEKIGFILTNQPRFCWGDSKIKLKPKHVREVV